MRARECSEALSGLKGLSLVLVVLVQMFRELCRSHFISLPRAGQQMQTACEIDVLELCLATRRACKEFVL